MKRFLLIIACLLNAVWASAQFSGSGTGTESDPYLIYNESQLAQVANFLNQDGVVFKLQKDIDLTNWIAENNPNQGWIPIGVETTPFKGKFYGNGHKLSGIVINRSQEDNVGFFGVTDFATIKDLSLEAISIKGRSNVGAIVGKPMNTTLSGNNVIISNTLFGNYNVGGLSGYTFNTTISSCRFQGDIIATNNSIGGCAGYLQNSSINSTQIYGNVTSTEGESVGGIVGYAMDTNTLNSINYIGDVKGTKQVSGGVGKLEAASSNTFASVYSKGTITNTGDFTGGIIGLSAGGCIASMESCSHFGDITGKNYIGGLIGALHNDSNSETVYLSKSNTENTKYTSRPTAVFVTSHVDVIINNSTSIGNINGSGWVGGLIGWDEMDYTCSDWLNGGPTNIRSGYESNTEYYLWYGNVYTGSKQNTGAYGNSKTWSPNFKSSALSFTNSYYSGVIDGKSDVGGIAGYKFCGKVQNCYTYATIRGESNVGGIVGRMNGNSKSSLTLKSNVAINAAISATSNNVGRVYGTKDNDYIVIGAMASAEGNRALTQTSVMLSGVAQDVVDNLQNGMSVGPSTLKLKANYVAYGWDFDNNWDILETECYPFKRYQAAPPVIESELVSNATEISGSSFNGGTVFMYYKDRDAVSTECVGNNWVFTTDPLQSGAQVQLYADAEGLVPSYLTSSVVKYPGSGTEEDPYRIYTAEDLQGASNAGYYKLMNDIDLTTWINENYPTTGWPAVGRNSTVATYINGDGHKISGLWISTTEDYNGLFSNYSAGYIKNLNVEVAAGKSVKGGDYTGILIGRMYNGQIINCSVKGDVEGTLKVGGVVGYVNKASLENLSFDGKATSNTANSCVGGIVGLVEDTNSSISQCKSYSTISTSGSSACVGGLVGKIQGGSIQKSLAETTVSATGSGSFAGGLVGYSSAKTDYCYSTGTVTATGDNSYVGGLIGRSTNAVADCYSTSNVTGTQFTAGLVGYTFSSISRCYATGDINGVMYGAGVVGELDGSSASLSSSVAANNTLTLTDQTSWGCRVIGGFKNGAAEPTLGSNFALNTMQVSLNGVPQTKTDDNIEGVAKTKSVLMSSATYTELGWDLSKVWSMDEGQMFPYLLWEVDVNPVADISFDKTSIIVSVGNEAKINASVLPLGATNKRLEWTTANSTIATVADGVVTGVGQGSTTITATATDGSGVFATCTVTVVANHDDAIAELQTLVDQAQALYDNSKEGDEIGQYAVGSRAALLSSINNVKSQISSTMGLEAISTCTTTINQAIESFNSKKVTAGEDTDITDYDNILYVSSVEGYAGRQLTLSLKMKNNVEAAGFQTDIYLPEGMTFAVDGDDFPLVELSTARTTSKKTDYFNAVIQNDGALRILCSSTKGYAFEGTDGEVATFTIDISETMADGTYPLIMKNMEISERSSQGHTVDYFKSSITISSYTLGDANADGNITVSDFTAIANHILGSTPANFVLKAADVNQDNTISVSDLTGVANIILYGSPTGASSTKDRNAGAKEGVIVRAMIPQSTLSVGGTVNVPVTIQNIGADFSAFQFDVKLPEGLAMEDAILSTDRTDARSTDFFTWRRMDNGVYRVLCASTTGKIFSGNDGCVAVLTIKADNEANEGLSELSLTNIELSENGKRYLADDVCASMIVGSATGIDSINNNGDGKAESRFNAAGQRVGSGYRGIVIYNNTKHFVTK